MFNPTQFYAQHSSYHSLPEETDPAATTGTTAYASSGLPSGWEAAHDRNSQQVYYVHTKSQHTQWERPSPLLPGWTHAIHKHGREKGQLYYFNTVTREKRNANNRPEDRSGSQTSQPVAPAPGAASGYPGYSTGPFSGPSITPPRQTPSPPVETLTGGLESLSIGRRSPSAFEAAIRATHLGKARQGADRILGRTSWPGTEGISEDVLAQGEQYAQDAQFEKKKGKATRVAEDQTHRADRYVQEKLIGKGTAKRLHGAQRPGGSSSREESDIFGGQKGSDNSISSWAKLSPTHSEWSSLCENIQSKMAFDIVGNLIYSASPTQQRHLCQVLVNDVKRQITADLENYASSPWFEPEETGGSHGKTIRSAMELLVGMDANTDDYAFSDLMMDLENFRRANEIGYTASWGEEDV